MGSTRVTSTLGFMPPVLVLSVLLGAQSQCVLESGEAIDGDEAIDARATPDVETRDISRSGLVRDDAIGTHTAINAEVGTSTQAMAYLDSAGVRWIRAKLPWSDIEWVPDRYRWQAHGIDAYYDSLHSNGFRIMAVIQGSPDWARDPRCPRTREVEAKRRCPPRPGALDEFQEFVSDAAARYPYIDHWEVWNEAFREDAPHDDRTRGDQWFDGTSVQLDTLIRRVRAALGPEDRVVCCGSGPAREGRSDRDWAARMYDRNRDHVDYVSVHMYGKADRGRSAVAHVEDVLADLDRLGHPDAGVILSEWGQGDPNVVPPGRRPYASAEDQGRAIRTVLRAMDRNPRWLQSYWYNFNRMEDTTRIVVHGALRVRGARYPVLCALAREAGEGENAMRIPSCR